MKSYFFQRDLSVLVLILVSGSLLFFACAVKEPAQPETKEEVPVISTPQEPVIPQEPEPVLSAFELMKKQAQDLVAAGRIRDAFVLYNQGLVDADDQQRDFLMEGINQLVRQMNNRLIEELLMLYEHSPSEPILLYRLGMNYVEEGSYQKAINFLSLFLETYPDHENAVKAGEQITYLQEHLLNKTTIGCLLPLSGKFSTFGRRALRGLEMALHVLQGEYTQKITIIVKDTESDPDRAAECVNELSLANVAAIAGPIITAERAGEEAQKYGIPLIALTQKSDFASRGDYLFANFLTPEMQARTLVTYLSQHLGVRSYAILYPQDKYGTTYMNLFWDMVDEIGGEIVGVESYENNRTDFTDAIRKLTGLYYPVPEFLKLKNELLKSQDSDFDPQLLFKTEDPESGHDSVAYNFSDYLFGRPRPIRKTSQVFYSSDYLLTDTEAEMDSDRKTDEDLDPIVDFGAIFIPDAPSKVGLILPQLVYNDVIDIFLMGPNIWHSDSLLKDAAGYIKNAVISEGYFAESSNPNAADFARIFREFYNEAPGFIEAVAFDTITMIARTAMEPSVESRKALRDALAGKRLFDGATGKTMFDQNGNPHKELFLLTVKRGRFVEITR